MCFKRVLSPKDVLHSASFDILLQILLRALIEENKINKTLLECPFLKDMNSNTHVPSSYFFLSQHGCDKKKKKKNCTFTEVFLNSIKIKSNLPNIFFQKRVKVKTNRKKMCLLHYEWVQGKNCKPVPP